LDAASLFRVVNPPASTSDITSLLDAYGQLPASYLTFLTAADGTEWCINDQGGDCLALWRAREISELNQAYEIPRYLPDLMAIGSNGGDDAIGFDRASSSDPEYWAIVRIGFGNLDRADLVRLATGFRQWLSRGCSIRSPDA
jgi:hypothetical protein